MRLSSLMVLLCVAGGCRDLTVPEKQVGRVSGFAVLTGASGQVEPAAGAVISIAGTSLRTIATSQGAFTLSPIPSESGDLVLTSGALARSLDFKAYNIGPTRQTELGQVSLRSSATISGQVNLRPASGSSNAGITVFLPGLPVATVTSDTGAFMLRGVPEGSVSVAASRLGYATKRVDDLTLRSGELFTLAPLTLEAAAASMTRIAGRVELEPSGDVKAVSLLTISLAGAATVTVSADGRFETFVPAGGVTLLARAPGFSDAALANLNVPAQTSTLDVGVLRLVRGTDVYPLDAGSQLGPSDTGCGDGTVGVTEACDDGNRFDGDGCAADCTLERQLGGGGGCLDATPVKLSPVGPGRLAATIQVDKLHGLGPATGCVGSGFQQTTFVVRLAQRAFLNVLREGQMTLNGPLCRPLSCTSGGVLSALLDAGEYVIAFELVMPLTLAQITVSVPPSGPFCGDGQTGEREECDDGNTFIGDGCNDQCKLELQSAGPTCASAPLIPLAPTGPRQYAAKVDPSALAANDTALKTSCFDINTQRTEVYRVTLPSKGSLFVEGHTPGGVGTQLAVFSGTCRQATELGCSPKSPADALAVLNLTSLDAGVYTVLVGSQISRPSRGRVAVELE